MLDAAPSLAKANWSPPRHLTEIILGRYSKDIVIQESVRRQLAELRSELEGLNPTPLERLLAERAALCWLNVYRYESIYATSIDLTLRQAAFQERRIETAHRLFLSALRTLAQIRKLALPAVQVNIAERQVNVAGG
jgi:hypothetical protein